MIRIKEFHHLSRECRDLEKSRSFYEKIIGFQVIARPPFETAGYWMSGHSICVHLFESKVVTERSALIDARWAHFNQYLPEADHIAFLVDDIPSVEAVLVSEHIHYKKNEVPLTGATQLFVFDPDNNVIELSNCAPPNGELKCIT